MLYDILSYDTSTHGVGLKHKDHVLDLEVVGLLGYFDTLAVDPVVFRKSVLADRMFRPTGNVTGTIRA